MDREKTILITGGAGFIGSHVDKYLREAGYRTLLLDNLSRSSSPPSPTHPFIQADVGSTSDLDRLFTQYSIDAVMHFAAYIDVGESIKSPELYYQNNVCQTLQLLLAMQRHAVDIFIFSSTAAVYGTPQQDLIDENHPLNPINAYGRSKWMVEQILRDFSLSSPLRYCCFRYFNAAGGDPEGLLKSAQTKVSNLIPLALRTQREKVAPLTIYGTDYPTRDGSCIRDYVHVYDLAQAHLLGMEALLDGAPSNTYNLGNGSGFTVCEVLDMIEKVTGEKVPAVEGPRRPGDPAFLVANSQLARVELEWQPRYPSLAAIIEHAWKGQQKAIDGPNLSH